MKVSPFMGESSGPSARARFGLPISDFGFHSHA
jgi:hypothetical protein